MYAVVRKCVDDFEIHLLLLMAYCCTCLISTFFACPASEKSWRKVHRNRGKRYCRRWLAKDVWMEQHYVNSFDHWRNGFGKRTCEIMNLSDGITMATIANTGHFRLLLFFCFFLPTCARSQINAIIYSMFTFYSIDTANLQVYGGFYNAAPIKLPNTLFAVALAFAMLFYSSAWRSSWWYIGVSGGPLRVQSKQKIITKSMNL